ncbi:MAG: IS630 family transposase [Oscillospiraceae bacterium]|nr:IS630 family transposase [Oscillospiraceae bacterium]
MKDIPEEKIAYVDETGIDSYLYREYGYSPRGQKVYEKISGRKFQRTSIVAAKLYKKIIAPMQYSGTMNSALFEFWFEKCLLPCLEKGTTIVMDNASFHQKKYLYEICKKYGVNLIFLPPYSPALNPIEKYWFVLKHRIRAFLRINISLNDAIHYVLRYP